MEKKFNKTMMVLTLLLASGFSVAGTLVFDTVTSYKSGAYEWGAAASSITGLEKDTGNTITATFGGSSTYGTSSASVCSPLVITVMEKPGRYYLHVSWDESDRESQVTYCMLELKTIPQ